MENNSEAITSSLLRHTHGQASFMGQQLLSRDSLDYLSDTVADCSILDDMSTDDE